MAATDSAEEEAEKCSDAWIAVTEVAMESCQTEEQTRRVIARMLGVDADVDCGSIRADGITSGVCDSSKRTREWVLCRSSTIVMEEDVSIPEAFEQAWRECRDGCGEFGIEV